MCVYCVDSIEICFFLTHNQKEMEISTIEELYTIKRFYAISRWQMALAFSTPKNIKQVDTSKLVGAVLSLVMKACMCVYAKLISKPCLSCQLLLVSYIEKEINIHRE